MRKALFWPIPGSWENASMASSRMLEGFCKGIGFVQNYESGIVQKN